jgi:general secretion pathway protein G
MKLLSHRASIPVRRRGFTLVELLVVIAIIVVLAAISLGTFRSMKASAQTTKCAGNLKQIGTAFSLWAADNNGVIKSRDYSGWIHGEDGFYCRSWVSNLNSYLMSDRVYDGKNLNTSEVFRCPEGEHEEWNGASYAANIYLGGFRDPEFEVRMGLPAIYSPRRMASCLDPARCVIVVDCDVKAQGFLDADFGGPQSSPPVKLRHKGGINALFADGHVEWMNPKTMPEAEYHAKFRWNGGALWPPSGL